MIARPLRSLPLGLAAALAASAHVAPAYAGDFDARGVFSATADATYFDSFADPALYLPADTMGTCAMPHFELVTGATDALEGDSYVRLNTPTSCADRFVLFDDGSAELMVDGERPPTPHEKAMYRASIWIRHGSAGARFTVRYSDNELVQARLAPTGRATSDGWIELASNEIPIDGTRQPLVYIRMTSFATEAGVDLDGLELERVADYRDQPACSGVRDPVCGPDALCLGGNCKLGGLGVPPLPRDEIKDEMVDTMKAKLEIFFGAKKTRAEDLPLALETLEAMRHAETAWQFWNGWGTAVRQLHDWHTNANSSLLEGTGGPRLNVCFIEGDADLSQTVAPKHPQYRDILVSHVGLASAAGLRPGDRLVAIDGKHPIEWARGLVDVDWGYHIACDATSFADLVEALGGFTALIARYASNMSVIRCDAATLSCSDQIETIAIDDSLSDSAPVDDVYCDNRPSYHLGASSPDANNHYVFSTAFTGRVDGTSDEEKIYGMVWDDLYGGGVATSGINKTILDQSAFWKQNARGVILDHRAGNGGTNDSVQYMTQLVRPQELLAATLTPMETAGSPGPQSVAEGLELFTLAQDGKRFIVGSPDHDPTLPVALILHRDGSSSDFLPLGMKGAPKVKLFGPGPTAGAFSTFIQFSYWGGMSFQLASGDTIRNDGVPMLGTGVLPDVVVQQKQSDLMVGVDSIHEAALAWVRQELKP